MFSKRILARLLERTKEGAIRWQIIGSVASPHKKRYETVHNLMDFKIASTLLSGIYQDKHYRLTLEIEELKKDGRVLLSDSGEWKEEGPKEEDVDMMYRLVSLVEEQHRTEQEEKDKGGREEIIERILEKI